MPRKEAFTIPGGLRLSAGPDGTDIEYDGDIVLQGSPLPRLGRIRSSGGDVHVKADGEVGSIEAPNGSVSVSSRLKAGSISGRAITMTGELQVGEINATGALELRGATTANAIRGESVFVESPTLSARSIEGRRGIRVGRGRIQADVLIAPSVVLDSGVSGKITVVESHNDLGAHAVRGCLRLADLDDMGGNAQAFLEERGLTRLDSAAPTVEPVAAPVVAPSRAPSVPAIEAHRAETAPPAPPAQLELEDDVDEIEPEPVEPSDPVQDELNAVLSRILGCYGGDLPPAIVDIRDWIQRRDYAAVRDGITGAWNQLLKYHQKQGLRIQPQVTSSFNQLNALVRKL